MKRRYWLIPPSLILVRRGAEAKANCVRRDERKAFRAISTRAARHRKHCDVTQFHEPDIGCTSANSKPRPLASAAPMRRFEERRAAAEWMRKNAARSHTEKRASRSWLFKCQESHVLEAWSILAGST